MYSKLMGKHRARLGKILFLQRERARAEKAVENNKNGSLPGDPADNKFANSPSGTSAVLDNKSRMMVLLFPRTPFYV